MRGDMKADVAVIGAGYSGLSTALHLAGRGLSAAVLEAGDIGSGCSGRNAGLVNAGLWLPLPQILKLLGQLRGESLIQALGEAPSLVFDLIDRHRIACEALPTGTLHCAHSKKGFCELENRAEEWLKRKAPVELLDREKAAVKLGTDVYHGALLDRRAGTVQPLAYARGLGDAALKAGARIFRHSPVIGLKRGARAWQATTPGGVVTADKVAITVGAYGQGPAPWTVNRTVALYYFQFATETLSDAEAARVLPERHGAWDTNPVLSSFRKDAANRLIIGSIGRLDRFGDAVHRSWARRNLARLYPFLADKALTHAWFGRIAITSDHLPRLAEPAPGVVTIYGYNGRGIGPGTVFGREIAEFLASGKREALSLPVVTKRSERFAAGRSAAIEIGARLYHLVA